MGDGDLCDSCEYLAMKAKMLSFIVELGINVKSYGAGARFLFLDSRREVCGGLDKLVIVRMADCSCIDKALC